MFVPTTASFREGMNRVALEAAPSGRPAVVSSTTPAAELLGDAVITVPTGDIEGYARALQRLADDPERYDAACNAAAAAGATLLDRDASLEAVLGAVLDEMFPRAAAGTLGLAAVPRTDGAHGAVPDAHSFSSCSRSRWVSMHAQKPRCLKMLELSVVREPDERLALQNSSPRASGTPGRPAGRRSSRR